MKRFLLTALFVLGFAAIAGAQVDLPSSGIMKDSNGNARLVQYAKVNPSTATTTEVVPAQGAGQKIRVLATTCVPTIANSLTFNSASTAISALFPVGANGLFILQFNPHGWFQTNANEALNLVTSAATVTGCSVVWIATN